MAKLRFLAVDSGTTSCRAIVFDSDGLPVATAARPFRQHYPTPGWVEHDAEEILAAQREAIDEAVSAAGDPPVAAVGVANQRETVVLWDRATGKPVAPAIVWQCRRTTDACRALRAAGAEPEVRARTGLLLDPYFSATKIAWLLDRDDTLRRRAEAGELAAGTIDTWLLWHLSGGGAHVTDASNASRTSLFNLRTGAWDPELCALFRVPMALLPAVHPHGTPFATMMVGGRRVAVGAMLGDQQAALQGQGCRRPGEAKSTYGTGCFLLAHAGDAVPTPPPGLLATVAWQTEDRIEYALEGSVFIAGAVVQWLRDEMGLVRTAEETAELAASVPDTGGVHFVPAFTGLGAPWWRPDARGIIDGITRGTNRAHIVRAALEAIAFQNRDVLSAMDSALPQPIRRLQVDGGASRNDFLMQFQADILGIPVRRPAHHETTALGAVRMAARSLGIAEIGDGGSGGAARTYEPTMDPATRTAAIEGWRKAVGRQLGGDD